MKSIDWNEVRARALGCLNSSLELLTWARDSQQEDYDVGSATLHLAAIDKARNNAENFLRILTSGIDGSSKTSLCQFPICDQLAQASAGETARPDFGVAATAHEAVFRLLMIALLHIENNLKGGLTLEDLHGVSPEKRRVTLCALEKKDSMEHVLGGVGNLHNLQAWIHREWANVSDVHTKKRNKPEKPQEQGVNPNGNTHSNGLELDGPLTKNDRCILAFMYTQKIDAISPMPSAEILKGALYTGNDKEAFDNLKELGLVDARTNVGRWLTDKGRSVAKEAVDRREN